ncbi:MAG: SDR family NAD(P)-dependent oxidoreductase, partial [Halieaceae bacterium]
MLLKDKVIVISGVGPGLGQTMAKMACAEGAAVILGARNQEFLTEVASEIEASGGQVVAQSTDVADTAQVNALITAGAD